jgi:serine/threonine protein kinase
MTLKDAIAKMNCELNQKIDEPITVIGTFIATQFFDEMINGIQYLHSSSPPIIHRDLKPSNIFVTDGRGGNFIKIGDFGLSVIHNDENDHTDIPSYGLNQNNHSERTQGCGTDGYMAPEVRNSSSYNELCDIFSLGCILLELLCLRKDPFTTNFERFVIQFFLHNPMI